MLVVLAIVGVSAIARRMGYSGMGGNTVVRCRKGHYFTTIWVPGVSLKAIRLGWLRLQYCPIGEHWTLVKPIKNADLTEDEIAFAHDHRDIRIP